MCRVRAKRQWPNLASTYQDAQVHSDWIVFGRSLTWGHPRSMNEWLAEHIAQNRNKSCWLTEIYFINSINCAFNFLSALSAQYLDLVTLSRMVFGVIQGKFLLTPATFSCLQVQHVTCKKIFVKCGYRHLALLTNLVSPFCLETLHAEPTETMTTWRRHLRVKNWVFARH